MRYVVDRPVPETCPGWHEAECTWFSCRCRCHYSPFRLWLRDNWRWLWVYPVAPLIGFAAATIMCLLLGIRVPWWPWY